MGGKGRGALLRRLAGQFLASHGRTTHHQQVFPPLGVVPIYRRLAETARVTYYPLYTEIPSNETINRMRDAIEGERRE